MPAAITLDALDLAALLCSRVCHDLISPAGAIVNGLEVLEESRDEETNPYRPLTRVTCRGSRTSRRWTVRGALLDGRDGPK